jgi:dTDP-4-amino-4,6-dideoxygalactose transaminase
VELSLIPLFKAHRISDLETVGQVLRSGYLGEGPIVARFTNALREILDDTPVVPLNSGTSAIQLALTLCGVRPGDTVISTPFTMIATNAAITAVGGRIEWCDAEPGTFCASIESIRAKMKLGVKAIVATCVGGLVPSHLEDFRSLSVPLILDCAHALTTRYRGLHISKWADFSCFSFQAVKHLTTGDGGALAINPGEDVIPLLGSVDEVFDRALRLKWFGLRRAHERGQAVAHQMGADVSEVGYKYQMNDIAAAVGISCLPLAMSAVQASIRNATYYLSALGDLQYIKLPSAPAHSEPSWWAFGFLCPDPDAVANHLQGAGVQASQLWRRNDQYSCFQQFRTSDQLSGVDQISREAIFIPSGWWLSESDRERIADLIIELFRKGR